MKVQLIKMYETNGRFVSTIRHVQLCPRNALLKDTAELLGASRVRLSRPTGVNDRVILAYGGL